MDERERGLRPLDDAASGCTLAFEPRGTVYQPIAALMVLAGLHARRRCTAPVSAERVLVIRSEQPRERGLLLRPFVAERVDVIRVSTV